jgi:hypothetical protein
MKLIARFYIEFNLRKEKPVLVDLSSVMANHFNKVRWPMFALEPVKEEIGLKTLVQGYSFKISANFWRNVNIHRFAAGVTGS